MTLLLSFLIATGSLFSQQVFVSDSPLCLYLEKVFTEAQREFAPFKAAESDSQGVFHGSLKFAPASECSLYPRRRVDGMDLPAEYVCTLGGPRYFFSEAQTMYDLSRESMRSCLSGWVYEERRRGGESSGYAYWYFRGHNPDLPGVSVTLRLNDLTARTAAAAGKKIEEITDPNVVVDISVTNTDY